LLNQEKVKIDDIVSHQYRFEAHENETIQEHTDKCVMFFEQIWKTKKLDSTLEMLEQVLLGEQMDECRQLFERLFLHTIIFHDIGKINPRFQYLKMNRQEFAGAKWDNGLGSRHSFISSVIYLQYFMPELCELSCESVDIMAYIIFINSYVISRHHVSLDNFQEYLIDFKEGKQGDIDRKKIFQYVPQYLHSKEIFAQDWLKYACNVLEIKLPNREYEIACYAYERLLFSLLVASDYYATAYQKENYCIESYGTITDINKLYQIYSDTDVMKKIRDYQKTEEHTEQNINSLRTELFLESEQTLLRHLDENIYYLEAPTGSGKSNTAMNLSFQLIRNCDCLDKIMYIYPFNTLVEQNESILRKIFGENPEAIEQIKVVNSITPIYQTEVKEENEKYVTACQKALLDRQFFNYPIAVSTHVTLFRTMFGDNREDAFSFHQLANSVIVLDEIQSYRNEIWTEIIVFLKMFAKLLHMKVIIMSATLPDLDILSEEEVQAVRLIADRNRYFQNDCFKKRVSRLEYSLLDIDRDDLFAEIIVLIKKHILQKQKILVEFITKKSALDFYECIREALDCETLCITGDDNSIERKRILQQVEDSSGGTPLVLVATQVIEAGVDLKNINVGFKDISMIDLEEQFLGRINRSNTGMGIVYFFNYDKAGNVYMKDNRKDFTLLQPEMRQVLESKDFSPFYEKVLGVIKRQNQSVSEKDNIDVFFEHVGKLNQKEIAKRMWLIEEDKGVCNIYFGRVIESDGRKIDGWKLWEEYEQLIKNSQNMKYSVFKVELSILMSEMNNFIYRIRVKPTFPYNDMIGELYYIDNGEDYFENEKININKLQDGIGEFI